MTLPTTASPAPATSEATLGTDYILNALAEEGLSHLFMVPGGLVDPFMPALTRQDRLMPVVAAHEGGAVFMADGYARASGSFGAAIGIGGPGACNMATAVATAKTDGSPLLVMTGEVPLAMEGRGVFQDASQATLDDTAVMAPLARLSKTVSSSQNLNHWFRHALTTMWSQPRGPVHLSLTHDALTGECAADYVKIFGYFAGGEPLSVPAADAALAAAGGPQARPHRFPRRRWCRTRCRRRPSEDAGRTLVHSRRHHAARQGRVPGGSRAVARRVRLCRQPPRHQRHPQQRSRLSHRARLGLQRARHDALDAARTPDRVHDPCEYRHGRAHRQRRPWDMSCREAVAASSISCTTAPT